VLGGFVLWNWFCVLRKCFVCCGIVLWNWFCGAFCGIDGIVLGATELFWERRNCFAELVLRAAELFCALRNWFGRDGIVLGAAELFCEIGFALCGIGFEHYRIFGMLWNCSGRRVSIRVFLTYKNIIKVFYNFFIFSEPYCRINFLLS
jgi:hypothetical protein